MTKTETQISQMHVIARSLPSLFGIGLLNDEAISLKRLSKYFREIAASEGFLHRINANSLLAMTGFKRVLEFNTWNLNN